MKKRSLISVVATITFTFNLATVAFAEPNTSAEQTIQENKVKYEQLDDETLKLNAEIKKLNNDIEEINLKLDKNNSEIKSTEIEIENINNKIEDSKIDIDKEIVTKINDKKAELVKDAKVVEEKKENLNMLKTLIENDLSEVSKKKEEQEVVLADLNSKKDAIMKIIEENEVNLISHSLSIINSGSASTSDLRDAITNLNYMLPQLNSNYALNLAQEGISSANSQIASLESANLEINVGSVSSTSSSGTYLSTFSMTATAYTGGSYTAMGLKPVRDPNGLSTISVDPNVIPLGSKVYVEGYGYAIASDTGGVIKGNKIDLYMNSLQECYSFGRRTVILHIIAYPNQW